MPLFTAAATAIVAAAGITGTFAGEAAEEIKSPPPEPVDEECEE